MLVREVSWNDHARIAEEGNVEVPLEQTETWANYQREIDGRDPWLPLVVERGDKPIALVLFIDFMTHGYHYVRSSHGPLWLCEADEQLEREVIVALRDYVRVRDRRQVFMRLAIAHELDITSPVLSTIPYDATVIINLTGSEEDIISRMKKRGRRDVRKALRESPITCADETDKAMASFAEYYAIMCETAERDGFAPAPIDGYELMLRTLGTDHVRVFAGRLEDGRLCTWSICTMQGKHATRYYAASLSETMRMYVTDRLCYFECCELKKLGCDEFDLMGIGTDFSPSLKGLNTFKTKFANETTPVAPDRDVAVRAGKYKLLCSAKDLRGKLSGIRNRG